MFSRVTRLLVGLVIYGTGAAFTVAAGLGVDPWTVFAQGISRVTGVGIGWVTNIVGLGVLLLWIPLRQKPGVGTIANILLVGTSLQLALAVLPHPDVLWLQALMLVTGVVLVAVASGLYIGANFGPGPRDGLMTGLHGRFGWPIWACRLAVEGTVLVLGWLLGGTVGIGTVIFALGIGPLVHIAMPLLATPRPAPRLRPDARV
ncbi:hypothetical protein [uncultured Microbacterium sp.]|uniref:membrane protein YczE n=1 Tax=uncultured Microbacterium sp. TaxID=191216 RepID=UPI00261A51FB|nr:hypothetical protein [uncultured Microbacterium sp.]